MSENSALKLKQARGESERQLIADVRGAVTATKLTKSPHPTHDNMEFPSVVAQTPAAGGAQKLADRRHVVNSCSTADEERLILAAGPQNGPKGRQVGTKNNNAFQTKKKQETFSIFYFVLKPF